MNETPKLIYNERKKELTVSQTTKRVMNAKEIYEAFAGLKKQEAGVIRDTEVLKKTVESIRNDEPNNITKRIESNEKKIILKIEEKRFRIVSKN